MSDFVLVVDDNRDAADLLAELVRHCGFEVLAVYDGQEAIRRAAIHSPDMVLLDLGMPDVDGFDVAAGIRGQPSGSHVVIVAITGLTGEDAKRHAYEAGFDLFISKPVSIAVLTEVLAILDPPDDNRGERFAVPRQAR